MSYLDVPRIHFMGLFYSAPGNLNNTVANYDLSNPDIVYNTGLYKYPDGTSQLWLERCVVTSVVGPDGQACSDPQRDALVGAQVTSPSPEIPKPDGQGGLYALAKMVDLDPNMQFRTEVYGLRIYVDIQGGGGFSGEIALPPQLRDLWFGRGKAGIAGLQIAVGTWHQRLTHLTWTAPAAPSPVFDALRAHSSAGLDVKMGVDMFQTDRGQQFTQGNRFGYGRLVGSIGPAATDEPVELVPGRRLYTPRTFDSAPAAESRMMAKADFTRQTAEVEMSGANAVADWNRTDFRVRTLQDGRTLLIVDLFNAAPLADGQKGQLETGGTFVVGFLDGAGFTPLQNGQIALDYTALDTATRKLRDIVWPQNAAIVQIELNSAESQRIAHAPVAIQAGGATVLRENPNGVYVNIERATTRLEPNSGDIFDVFAYAFGQPSPELPAGLKLGTALYVDKTGAAEPTTIFTASLDPRSTGSGRFRLSVNTGPAVPLTDLRKPLDSFLCFLTAAGDGYLVGEAMTLKPQTGPPTPPFLSLIFWQNHKVVDLPTWEQNIQPLMAIYARMFPGMVSILNIGDLGTIKSFAPVIRARFQLDRNDPGFMPVSRDMSPATVQMMLRFLDSLTKEQP